MEECRVILFFCFSFDFSVSLPDVQRRTLDVAVKNSGGFVALQGFSLYADYCEQTVNDLRTIMGLADVILPVQKKAEYQQTLY